LAFGVENRLERGPDLPSFVDRQLSVLIKSKFVVQCHSEVFNMRLPRYHRVGNFDWFDRFTVARKYNGFSFVSVSRQLSVPEPREENIGVNLNLVCGVLCAYASGVYHGVVSEKVDIYARTCRLVIDVDYE